MACLYVFSQQRINLLLALISELFYKLKSQTYLGIKLWAITDSRKLILMCCVYKEKTHFRLVIMK